MKTLNRLLLLALAVTLVGSVYLMYMNTVEIPVLHETYYKSKYPWLLEARHISLFGVLIWCVLFARSEPVWVRLGLVAVLLAVAIPLLPPHLLRHPSDLPSWH